MKIIAYLKSLRFRQILTIFLAGMILCVTTACNPGDARGARPDVPPVQLGGQNNPHKMGGDGYTKYKQSPDPNVKGQAMVLGDRLLAAVPNIEQENPGLLYKGDTETSERTLPIISDEQNSRRSSPNEGQSVIDRSNPNEGILEKTKEAFKEGSEFLQGAGEQVSPRSE